jgi:hypothetical protein
VISGKPKTTGIAVAKLDVDWLHPVPLLKVTAAFVDERSGSTVAWLATQPQWSAETGKALQVLRGALERDLARAYLESTTDTSTPTTPQTEKEPPKGLGELFRREDDTPPM